MKSSTREGILPRTFSVEKAIELANSGLSNYAIATALGVDESRIRAAFRTEGFKRDIAAIEADFWVDLDKPITLVGDVGITADFHIPLYDKDYTNTMIQTFVDAGIKTLVVAGDFLNMDELSRFEDHQKDANLERELAEAVKVMGILTENFDRIVYIWGNHDARLHKALGLKLQFKSAMKLIFNELEREYLGKIEFTNLDHAWVQTEDGERWYICHPANYTRVPLTTARVLAAKLNANVITAHSHHCAVGYALDGEHVIAEIGGLFDKEKTAYLQRTTSFPTWTQGFALLKDGKLRVHSPGWSLI